MVNDLVYLERQFDKDVAQVLRAPTVGMTLLPLNTTYKGMGKKSIEGFGYTARAGSKISMSIDHNMADTIDITGTTVKVPVIQDQVVIPRRTYQAYVDNAVPLDSDLAFDMTRNNNAKIDDLVMNGWAFDATTYEVLGLNQIAGTSTTGAVTSTYGNGYISLQTAIDDLNAAGVYSDSWDYILYSDNYSEIRKSFNSTSGAPEMKIVQELLGPGGRMIRAPTTANTAVVKPSATDLNRMYFDLIETLPPMHHAWFKDGNEKTGDVMVEQVTMLVPRFKHVVSSTDTCVSKITGL
jgi:hypothetical protein